MPSTERLITSLKDFRQEVFLETTQAEPDRSRTLGVQVTFKKIPPDLASKFDSLDDLQHYRIDVLLKQQRPEFVAKH